MPLGRLARAAIAAEGLAMAAFLETEPGAAGGVDDVRFSALG